ncbi:hypothetical protein [Halorhabdus rudnickae]|uniref:hypothetical protein n=1 Tax=Halorhabdus rudnickae TaxID=1775544 RepID=UPI001438361A|nr:hypothetical protein [Halorhabdus rudnickae]
MFDLRKRVLAAVAEYAREDRLTQAKHEGARLIQRLGEGDAEKAAQAFRTSFDKAKEMIGEDVGYDLEIREMPPILEDHDGEIEPHEIAGETVEVARSVNKTGFGQRESSLYPIVAHPSGYRVCTCPAQKYYIVCPHTLARVIERNWPEAPLPA